MKTFRRLIYKEIFYTVSFVALSFIALFFFFDMVDELKNIGKNNSAYEFKHALMFVVLTVPSHLYELMPISVLIGTILSWHGLLKALNSRYCEPVDLALSWHCEIWSA